MTNDSNNSSFRAFDEICHITIDSLRKMDMESLLILKKQATIELDRAKFTKGIIELALVLKKADYEQSSKNIDPHQQSLLDD